MPAFSELKAFLAIDQLMLQSPCGIHRQESMHNRAAVLERRIRWFWQGQRQEILKDAMPEDRLQRKQSSAAAEEKRWRAKAKRIHTLAMSGEEGRALAAFAVQGERPSGPAALTRLL